jgi:DNA-binding transcriptional regulator YhcF (GntR family)
MKKASFELEKWLDKYLRYVRPGTRLPTDNELALKFDVSSSTAKRITVRLAGRGKVVRIPGKGTFSPKGAEIAEQVTLEVPRTSSERLAETLLRMIHKGELISGDQLPQFKYLCLQYHLTPSTVTKAFRLLEKSGHAIKIGKTYWVGSGYNRLLPTRRREILFLAHGVKDPSVLLTNSYCAEAYPKMERELVRHNFFIRYATSDRLQELGRKWIARGILPAGIILSHDADCGGTWEEMEDRVIPRLLGIFRKAGSNAPVLFDNIGIQPSGLHSEKTHWGHIGTAMVRTLAAYIAKHRYPFVTVFLDTTCHKWGKLRPFNNIWTTVKLRQETRHLDPSAKWRIIVRSPEGICSADRLFDSQQKVTTPAAILGILNKYEPDSVEAVKNDFAVRSGSDTPYSLAEPRGLWIAPEDSVALSAAAWLLNFMLPARLGPSGLCHGTRSNRGHTAGKIIAGVSQLPVGNYRTWIDVMSLFYR